MRVVLENSRKGREGEAGTTPFGIRRQMRPHSFFSFIPSVTFTARPLTLRPSLLQRSTFLILYWLARVLREAETTTFTMRLAVEQLVLARQGTKMENVQWAIINMLVHHSGASRCYFYWWPRCPFVFFWLFSFLPSDCNFLTIFLYFSASAGLPPVFRLETFPLQPPTTHPDAFPHPFILIFLFF